MANRLTALLVLTGAGLGAALALQIRGHAPDPGAAGARPAQPVDLEPVSPPRIDVPELAALTETVERPLFSPDRRPPPDDAPDPEPVRATSPTAAPGFVLSAVIITGDQRSALMRDPGTGNLTRVREGDQIGGWTLQRVEPEQVVMVNGERTEEVGLRTYQPPPRPPAAQANGKPRAAIRPEEARTGPSPADLRRPRRPLRGPRQRYLENRSGS